MTERVQKLRRQLLDVKPEISIERLRIENQSVKDLAGLPIPLFRANIFKNVMEQKTVRIYEGELLVGTVTEKVRASDIFPEYYSGKLWLYDTLPTISTRKCDPFEISEEEIREAIEQGRYQEYKRQKLSGMEEGI